MTVRLVACVLIVRLFFIEIFPIGLFPFALRHFHLRKKFRRDLVSTLGVSGVSVKSLTQENMDVFYSNEPFCLG